MGNNLLQKNIPKGWEETTVSKIVEKIIDNRGKTPPVSSDGIEMIEVNAINESWKYPNYSKVSKYVSKETFDTWFRSGHPQKGDVLVPTVGTVGVAVLMNENRGCIAQNIIAVRVKKAVSSDFFYYIVTSPMFVEQIRKVLMGAVQPSLKVPHMLAFNILLPPKIEQEKIAEILGKVDEDIAIIEKVIKETEKLKKGLMQKLFTRGIIGGFMFDTNVFDKILDGKLDAEKIGSQIFITHIQEDEISAIKDKKRKIDMEKIFTSVGKRRLSTESAIFGVSKFGGAKFSSGDGLLNALQNGNYKNTKDALIAETAIKNNLTLVTEDKNLQKKVGQLNGKVISAQDFFDGNFGKFKETKLGTIADISVGGTPKTTINEYWDGDINWMASGEINQKNVKFTEKKITKLGLDNCNSKILPKNTVMIALAGQGKTRGTVAILDIETACNQSLAGIFTKDKKTILNEYIYYNLDLRYQELRNINGDEGRGGLNLQLLRDLNISYPRKIEKQKETIKIFLAFDKKISVNKKLKEKLIQLKKGLMSDLLSGEVRVNI